MSHPREQVAYQNHPEFGLAAPHVISHRLDGIKLLWLAPKSMNLEPIITSVPHVGIHWYDQTGDLVSICEGINPEVIAYVGTAGGAHMPSVETFRRLQEICPVILMCGDASDFGWHELLRLYDTERCFDLIVNFDGNRNWPGTQRGLTTLTPINPDFYHDRLSFNDRPIELGFAGGGGHYGIRKQIVEALKPFGLKVHDRDETYGSYAEYARFLKNCKITFNIPQSASGNASQVKGRVLEAGLAGTMLFEFANSVTGLWFSPKTHYTFGTGDIGSMIETIRYGKDSLLWVAERLHSEVTEKYSADKIWASIFERIF